MIRKLAPILLLGVAGCTPAEVGNWLEWWHDDQSAAVDFANQEWVQRSLDGRCAGPCDVDDPAVTESSNDSGTVEADVAPDAGGVYWPWTEIAQCESGGNWSINTGNGYYGGLQFALGSWQAVGGSGLPSDASPSEQVYRAELLKDRQGYGAWPTCRHAAGV